MSIFQQLCLWKYNKWPNQPSFKSENIWTRLPFHSVSLCPNFHSRCGAGRGGLLMKRKVGGRIAADAKVTPKKNSRKLCDRQKTRTLSFLESIWNISFHLLSDLNAFPQKNASKKKITCVWNLTPEELCSLLSLALSPFSPNIPQYSRYGGRDSDSFYFP